MCRFLFIEIVLDIRKIIVMVQCGTLSPRLAEQQIIVLYV